MADDREAKFLDALYFGARDGGVFDRAMALLADQFDCAAATVIDFDAVTPDISLACVAGFDPEFLRLYQDQFASIDPAPPAFANACPSGKASSTNRVFTQEELRKGVFANEWLRPAGFEETMAGVLTAREGRFAMVGLQRTPKREAFSDADITRLEALMPHLGRALELRRAFLGLERKAGIMSVLATGWPPAWWCSTKADAPSSSMKPLGAFQHGTMDWRWTVRASCSR